MSFDEFAEFLNAEYTENAGVSGGFNGFELKKTQRPQRAQYSLRLTSLCPQLAIVYYYVDINKKLAPFFLTLYVDVLASM